MGATIIHFMKIVGTHDISLLPQDARPTLNEIPTGKMTGPVLG
jgi:hypothetical protein